MARAMELGESLPYSGDSTRTRLLVPPHHLNTHAVITGMTGSGKTGLIMVMVEEALRAGVPVLMLDIKGDLPNLLLQMPMGSPASFEPWVDTGAPGNEGRSAAELAAALAASRDVGLTQAGIAPEQAADFRAKTHVRVITPGSTAGESVHLLSSLERRSPLWDTDPEAARTALSETISLVLRLIQRDAGSVSPEHVVLAVLAGRRLRANQPADLASLMRDLKAPPVERVGELPFDEFMPKHQRKELLNALNALVASPTFETWREGASLDVGEWLKPVNGKTTATIVSVKHLDEGEKAMVLGVVLNEAVAHMRTLPGTAGLRALVVFDEVYGYLPPTPRDPPTKRPLTHLLKQGRAFGLGVVVATQNPMDLDYRALDNAGLWCIGRLQTEPDQRRVVEGLTTAENDNRGVTKESLESTIKSLRPRWFLVRDGQAAPVLLNPRQTLSWLKGPLTPIELKRALASQS